MVFLHHTSLAGFFLDRISWVIFPTAFHDCRSTYLQVVQPVLTLWAARRGLLATTIKEPDGDILCVSMIGL
jgi:hypothetical protein